MNTQKFKITKIKEDPCIKDVAQELGFNVSTLRKKIKPYNIGYKRKGAGNSIFVRPHEIEKIKNIMTRKKL